jgi:hypothetical protein
MHIPHILTLLASRPPRSDEIDGWFLTFVPALLIAIILRKKCKTEIPHCFAAFMTLGVPVLLAWMSYDADPDSGWIVFFAAIAIYVHYHFIKGLFTV